MNRVSLRWIFVIPVLATISAGFLVFAIYIDQGDRSTRIGQIDQELTRAGQAQQGSPPGESPGAPAPAPDDALPGVEPPIDLTLSADGEVTDSSGGENPFTQQALDSLASTRERTFTVLEGHRALVSPLPDGRVSVTALSLQGFDVATTALRRDLVLGGLVIALLESAMVWWVAGRLVRPLADMAKTATEIADGVLDTEVPHAGGSREVANLSTDIERMVTRLRDALAERALSEDVATRARDDMKRLLADVSHEIRTPLTALQGYSDLYRQGMLEEPGATDRAMSRVGTESARLHDLVSSMLQLAGTGESRSLVVDDVDIAQVARAVVEDLCAAHPDRVIAVVLDEDADARVRGDAGRIHQALLNLGANACAHTESGMSVEIVVEATAPAVFVTIVDHGPGVDEADEQMVFLPFFRTDPSRVRNGIGGAGLGLAITRQVADEHHGSVSVAQTPGGGATFTLQLPRAGDAEPSAS